MTKIQCSECGNSFHSLGFARHRTMHADKRDQEKSKVRYIVICQQIVTKADDFETVYNWDGEYFDKKEGAVSHGFEIRESDDFNIGMVRNKRLIGFFWMDKKLDDYPYPKIEEQLCL